MKRLSVSIFLACIVFCVISIDAEAFTDGFVDQPVPWDANASQAMASSSGYLYYGSGARLISTAPNTFCFAVGNNCYVACKSSVSVRYFDTSGSSSGNLMSENLGNDTGYKYASNWWTTNSTIYQNTHMPQFPDIASAIAAMEAKINESLITSSFTIPAGWVAYFKTGSNASLSCIQPDYSMIGSNPFATNNQMFGVANSLPASGTQFPLSGMSVIPWQRGDNPNIWGQTRNSVATISNGSVYTVLYNPTFQEGVGGTGAASDDAPNGSIIVSVRGLSDLRMYPLSGQFLNTGSGYHFVSGSDSYDSDYVDGIIDPETGAVVFEDANGNVTVPNVGGQNSIPEIASAEGFFSAVKQILVGIANDLGTIFGFAYEAVVTLVNASASFVVTLGSLYAWLPSPVSSVLISAITVAITIGVFKAFL